MQKLNVKRNLMLFLASILVIVAACFMFAASPAKAEGNNSGHIGTANKITINLDVNGRDPGASSEESTPAAFTSANSGGYSVRYINPASVISTVIPGTSSAAYRYIPNSVINNSTSFDVEIDSSTRFIIIKALAKTVTDGEYFSVRMHIPNNVGTAVTASFQVKIDDTFRQFTSGVSSLYVGYEVVDGKENLNGVEKDSLVEGVHSAIVEMDNYTDYTFSLDKVLKGRALYNGATALTDNGTLWYVSSVENFTIKSATFPGLNIAFDNQVISNSSSTTGYIASSVTGTLKITPSNVGEYKDGDFWNTAHDCQLVLGEVDDQNVEHRIMVPVKFRPANPQELAIRSTVRRLNVTSDYRYEMGKDGAAGRYVNILTGEPTTDVHDYSALVISADNLVEYACPTDSDDYAALSFLNSSTRLNGSDDLTTQDGLRVEVFGEDQDRYYPTQYVITATKSNTANNNYTLSFEIAYSAPSVSGTGTTTSRYPVEITISTYGGYTIQFAPINGKKAVSYNTLTHNVFAEMRQRGYMLTNAKSNKPDALNAYIENNVLTLEPNIDKIDGQDNATVELTFTNNNNQVITFDSELVNINVNAGSLFARFEDWQAWLIIAACILGGIIIVLLIVWLFIRALSKRRQDELATQAPVSSYIVKLNSTIAATQAQQRAVQTQALSQASQMLLGAGPTGTAAPPPDTLQLASGVGSQPMSYSAPGGPQMSEPMATVPPDGEENLYELIAKYISDEELLERIFTEKYEPKGMVRRTFFKSKDLQTRELEKEKKRIIERYKTPMPMDEAIMSETEIVNGTARMSTPAASAPQEAEPEQERFVLDFDPDSPLYVEEEKAKDEFSDERIDLDVSPEEARVKELEHRDDVLIKELAELSRRLTKVEEELGKAKSLEDELREKIAAAEAEDEQLGKDIEGLEFSLATAKNRDKERITRDIGIKEEKKTRNADELERLKKELEALLGDSDRLNGISSKFTETQEQKTAEKTQVERDLEKARKELDEYLERLRQVQARQELEAKVKTLEPLLSDVDHTDYELRKLDADTAKLEKERASLKDAVAVAKSQILGATDFGIINDLNTQISDANARLSDIEKEFTAATKRKSSLNIDFNAQRRKANEFCQSNDIPVEEVVKAEDLIIGNIELDLLKASRENEKNEAEKAVAAAQAVHDDLAESANDVTLIAMDVAAGIKDIEDEIEAMQGELAAVNAQMETASDDERLMLMVEQGDKTDKIEELKAKLEQANIDGTKRKMEAQADYDAKLEDSRVKLDEAKAEFERAVAAYDELVNNTNPLDLITSGCGIISQDQKKIEAENLKKQLERTKNEVEQARLAAQMAKEQAEQAKLEADRAAEEARLEAERTAQEAIEQAEQARLEAERASEEARLEAERAKQEAQEALAAEAEEAKRKAQEEAEEAQRKAQEESEEAQRRAQEEAEEAKRKAQEEIDEMRRKADEEAEAKRLEEEAKRKEDEERQKAEAERNENLAKKIAMRKDQIIAIRNEMKDLKGDEDAKNLRERLYNIQTGYDEDERGSAELMSFYNKTMDDIQKEGEIARLKAENAKKPQRVVRKVTERVNRIAKRKPRPGARPARPGARPGAKAGARPAAHSGARPAPRPSARPAARPGARPAPRPGARPSGNRPTRPR